MASCSITSWQIDEKTVETLTGFIFLGFKITANGDCHHEIKRCLLLGRKAMTNLAPSLLVLTCALSIERQSDFPSLNLGWNPGLLHCRQILGHLRHQGSPLCDQFGQESTVAVTVCVSQG